MKISVCLIVSLIGLAFPEMFVHAGKAESSSDLEFGNPLQSEGYGDQDGGLPDNVTRTKNDDQILDELSGEKNLETKQTSILVHTLERVDEIESQEEQRGIQNNYLQNQQRTKWIQQLIKVQEAEEELQLQKRKNSCKKELMRVDKKMYNPILKVVTKILQPVCEKKKRIRGGVARLESGIEILNKLLQIHRNEEYGSDVKRGKLEDLLKEAQETLDMLQSAQKLPLDLQVSERARLGSFENKLKKPLSISAVGGNVAAGMSLFNAGIGGAIGCSKNICGQRKFALIGQGIWYPLFGWYPAGFLGVSCAAGYYNPDVIKKGPFLFDIQLARSMGLVLGGTSGKVHFEVDNKANEWDFVADKGPPYEVTIDIGFHLMKLFLFGGIELCSLPTDFKYFRKSIGITSQSGKLPIDREREIEEDHRKNVCQLDALSLSFSSDITTRLRKNRLSLKEKKILMGQKQLSDREWQELAVKGQQKLSKKLMSAVSKNCPHEVDIWIRAGADINHVNRDGSTALTWAAEKGYTEIVTLLLAQGANVYHVMHSVSYNDVIPGVQGGDSQRYHIVTALAGAALMGHTDILEKLLVAASNEQVDQATKDKCTLFALEAAISKDRVEIVEMLLNHIDVDKTPEGARALRIAVGSGNQRIANLLRSHGAVYLLPRNFISGSSGGLSGSSHHRGRGYDGSSMLH